MVALMRSNPGKQAITTLVVLVLRAEEKEKEEKEGEKHERHHNHTGRHVSPYIFFFQLSGKVHKFSLTKFF